MTLTESIKTCFQKYGDFEGRARRSEFWWFFLFCTASSLVLGLIPLLGQIYILALLMPSLAVSVRRLHDTGRSAWWLAIVILGLVLSLVMLFVIGFASAFGADVEIYAWIMAFMAFAIFMGCPILLLVFWALPGTVGPNRYGPDPLNPAPDVGSSGEPPYGSTPADPLSELEPGRRQFCSQCGTQLPQDGRFCAGCGTAI